MKYIRTKDGIYKMKHPWDTKKGQIKIADTIEELCDEFVIKDRIKVFETPFEDINYIKNVGLWEIKTIYGAIWTDKGLIYVAKMNEKGEMELL